MRFLKVLQLFFIELLLVTMLFGTSAGADPDKRRILVIKSRDVPFYNATLDGFISGLETRGYYSSDTTELKIISLTGESTKDAAAVKDQLSKDNTLVFTMGTDATIAVHEAHTSAPCIFTMLVDPVSLGVAKTMSTPGGSFTGTTLLVDPGKQLETLQQVSNHITKVGVVYTDGDATSIAFLATASEEAKALGIQIIAVPVASSAATSKAALQQLATKVDAFWMIVDPASAGPKPLADTLEVANANKLPILGMSNANVKSGALLSLSANLKDLGDVDAEMACPLIDATTTPANMPIRGPRQTMLSINLGAAKSDGITIPDTVLHLADEVIDDNSGTSGN